METNSIKLHLDSLEKLVIAGLACKAPDGRLIPLYPADFLQQWVVDQMPKAIQGKKLNNA